MTSNLQALWKGLAGVSDGTGWQTLGIRPQARCSISAAIRHPEVLEAVMLDVMASSIPSNLDLPEAQGFRVLLERRGPEGGAMAQLHLGDQAQFFPSDAALASWVAQADEGRAMVVYE